MTAKETAGNLSKVSGFQRPQQTTHNYKNIMYSMPTPSSDSTLYYKQQSVLCFKINRTFPGVSLCSVDCPVRTTKWRFWCRRQLVRRHCAFYFLLLCVLLAILISATKRSGVIMRTTPDVAFGRKYSKM